MKSQLITSFGVLGVLLSLSFNFENSNLTNNLNRTIASDTEVIPPIETAEADQEKQDSETTEADQAKQGSETTEADQAKQGSETTEADQAKQGSETAEADQGIQAPEGNQTGSDGIPRPPKEGSEENSKEDEVVCEKDQQNSGSEAIEEVSGEMVTFIKKLMTKSKEDDSDDKEDKENKKNKKDKNEDDEDEEEEEKDETLATFKSMNMGDFMMAMKMMNSFRAFMPELTQPRYEDRYHFIPKGQSLRSRLSDQEAYIFELENELAGRRFNPESRYNFYQGRGYDSLERSLYRSRMDEKSYHAPFIQQQNFFHNVQSSAAEYIDFNS